MAPRLAVVVSQAPQRDARMADIEESIVAERIMAGGLDATLVGPLERIQAESTDRLCLSGFTQDLALLSWMSAAEAAKWWSALGLGGTVVPISLDGSAVVSDIANPRRRIFYIQLSTSSVPKQVCDQLRARLDLMRVQPVSLQMNLTAPKKSSSVAKPVVPLALTPVVAAEQDPAISNLDVTGERVTGDSVAQSPALKPQSAASVGGDRKLEADSDSEAEWKSLDSLVDELDALDL